MTLFVSCVQSRLKHAVPADFEANNLEANRSAHFRFVDQHSGQTQPVCTDMLLTGAYGWHWTPAKGPSSELPHVVGEIPLSNERPSSGVIVEGNYHNPGGDHCPGPKRPAKFAAVFAAAAVGLRAEASDCSGCAKENRTCVAVATGAAPGANSSLEPPDARVGLNTGDFEVASAS